MGGFGGCFQGAGSGSTSLALGLGANKLPAGLKTSVSSVAALSGLLMRPFFLFPQPETGSQVFCLNVSRQVDKSVASELRFLLSARLHRIIDLTLG